MQGPAPLLGRHSNIAKISTYGISGLVVEYIVAIDVTRVRFPADAFPLLLCEDLAIRTLLVRSAEYIYIYIYIYIYLCIYLGIFFVWRLRNFSGERSSRSSLGKNSLAICMNFLESQIIAIVWTMENVLVIFTDWLIAMG